LKTRSLYLLLVFVFWAVTAPAAPKRAVVVVDALSSGSDWLEILREEDPNAVLIHVQSKAKLSRALLPPHLMNATPEAQSKELFGGYDYRFIYDSTTAARINSLDVEVLAVLRGTETAVYDAGQLAIDLNVPAKYRNLALDSRPLRNKAAQQTKLLNVKSIGHRPFQVVSTYKELAAFIALHGNPGIVFKPLESAGSNQLGVFPTLADMGDAFHADEWERFKLARLKLDHVLNSVDIFDQPIREVTVERFLQGVEYQVNGFAVGGDIEFTSLVQYHKEVKPGIGVLPDYDEWLPFEGQIQQELMQVVRDSAQEIGIHFDCVHAEVLRDLDGVYHIVEIANRPAGSRIPSIERLATGRSQMSRLARAILHPDRFEAEKRQGYHLAVHPRKIAFRYSGPDARIGSLDVFDQVRQLDGFHRLIPHYELDDEISESTSLTDTLALAWIMAATPEDATQKVRIIRALEKGSPQFSTSTNPSCPRRVVQFSRLAGIAPH
jgi:hypothetical protein